MPGRLFFLVVLLASSACEKRAHPGTPDAAPPPKPALPDASIAALGPALGPEVRARVNGVPITGEQLLVRLAGPRFGPNGERATLEQQDLVLGQAILAELQAQKALSMGLGAELADAGTLDPRRLELRRHELAKRYRMEVLLAGSKPTPQEVRAFFEDNKVLVQSEYQVQIIAFDSQADSANFLAAVQSGRTFEEVANHLYPGLPEPRPWAAQTLTFAEVPPRFAAALEALAPGEVSAVIPDVGEKGWLLRLVDRKTNPRLTFEKVQAPLTAVIQERRFEQRRVDDERSLRRAAQIEIFSPHVR